MSATPQMVCLDMGERIERTYWAAVQHYGHQESETQDEAEALAASRPTSIEVLSYEQRDAGVIPAGTGYVELRVVIARPDGSSTDTPIMRYPVTRERIEPHG